MFLRWHIQYGVSVIPKSVHEPPIRENGDIFDFSLDGLDRNARDGPDPEEVTQELFGVTIPD